MTMFDLSKNSKNIGFEFVKEFTIFYNNDLITFVHGGASIYLHALKMYMCKLPLNDIDFNIIEKSPENNDADVFDLLIDFTKKFCIKRNLSFVNDGYSTIGYIKLLKNDDILVELNFFINEIGASDIGQLENIFGVNVETFKIVYMNIKNLLDDYTSDLVYIMKNNGSSDEQKYLEEKIARKQEVVNFIEKYHIGPF
jgi:hypothetical protein